MNNCPPDCPLCSQDRLEELAERREFEESSEEEYEPEVELSDEDDYDYEAND